MTRFSMPARPINGSFPGCNSTDRRLTLADCWRYALVLGGAERFVLQQRYWRNCRHANSVDARKLEASPNFPQWAPPSSYYMNLSVVPLTAKVIEDRAAWPFESTV
jgi:hypothetical protein